ncbi:cation channel sperm-associated protein subunit zeta [Cricetulus griseus]|uniref:cation channel sperm-associated protein subunit zeta n=1 Tax=Cricetulus griseus TaxID=10029 RepID=UPI0015C39DDA|nr:cation channel sperm-associated protein subunit zeta [Cricetulus griseus]
MGRYIQPTLIPGRPHQSSRALFVSSHETIIAIREETLSPPPSWSVTPFSTKSCGGWSVAWALPVPTPAHSPCPLQLSGCLPRLPFFVCDPQAAPKHVHHRRSSVRSSLHGDVRDLWSTATLSTANVSVSDVCEDFDEEGRTVEKSRRYSQTISLKENLNLNSEEIQQQARLELELRRGRSLERDFSVEEEHDESVIPLVKSTSESSVSLSKQMPHQAYWTEQQNRLPLPLMELMENEVLEILSKALSTYKATIGKTHFMTKELQVYIEGLKKRRNQRLYYMSL